MTKNHSHVSGSTGWVINTGTADYDSEFWAFCLKFYLHAILRPYTSMIRHGETQKLNV